MTAARGTELGTTLGAILRQAEAVTGRATSLRVGPVPVTVCTPRHEYLDHVVAHHAGDPSMAPWRPLSVHLLDHAHLPECRIPEVLRPRNGRGPTYVARDHDLVGVAAGDLVWIVDIGRGVAMRWARTPQEVPIWEVAKPLRFALMAWSVAHGAALLHAAAIVGDGGATLLTGPGGTGKSTAAFACLGRGLWVLADDYCIGAPAAYPTASIGAFVHPTYRVGNLDQHSLTLLPHLLPRVLGPGPHGKQLIPLDPLPDAALHVPLRAVCTIERRPGDVTRVEALSRGEALRAIAPSTMFQLPGFQRETWSTTAEIVRRLEAYRLVIGDVDVVPDVLAELLGGVATC